MDEITKITSGYKKQLIDDILQGMKPTLNNTQLMELNKSLNLHTNNLIISDLPNNYDINYAETNERLIRNFIKVKKLKGLSPKSLAYYNDTLKIMAKWCIKSFLELTTDDIKEYLRFKQEENNCSNTSLNNTRRIISSFYGYLENEELILINPIKAIPQIKETKKVKKAFTDEEVERMRNTIYEKNNPRNIAIFEMLISSGLRISELLSLKKDDISLADCKGVCLGKGNKQRLFYFSEKAKLATQTYLTQRFDDSDYLFVQNKSPFIQLGVSGAEQMIRDLGKKAKVKNVHPHRFRRTLATRLIRKGMEIDQVSKILGHESLSVTQRYIESDRDMLKLTHNKHVN